MHIHPYPNHIYPHIPVSIKSVKMRSFPSLYPGQQKRVICFDQYIMTMTILPNSNQVTGLATVCLGSYSEFLFVARFERAIADFGMNTGVIATGLILLRMVDPESRTPVPADFAFKQLLHSPFMGGGIWTCLALPLLSILKYGKN